MKEVQVVLMVRDDWTENQVERAIEDGVDCLGWSEGSVEVIEVEEQ